MSKQSKDVNKQFRNYERWMNLQRTQMRHQARLKPMVREIKTMFVNGLPFGWAQ